MGGGGRKQIGTVTNAPLNETCFANFQVHRRTQGVLPSAGLLDKSETNRHSPTDGRDDSARSNVRTYVPMDLRMHASFWISPAVSPTPLHAPSPPRVMRQTC